VNEKISAVRLRAAKFAKSSPDAVELKIADEILAPNNDNKLLNLSQVLICWVLRCWKEVLCSFLLERMRFLTISKLLNFHASDFSLVLPWQLLQC
jgi:hypothetical protein